MITATSNLVLLSLSDTRSSSDSSSLEVTGGTTLGQLASAVGETEQRLSQRIRIVSALDELREQGLVEQHTDSNGETTVRLTEAGNDQVETVRDELASKSIEVVADEGRRHQQLLGDAASQFDRSLVEVAADCSSTGVYRHRPAHAQGDPTDFVGREREQAEWARIAEQVRDDETGQAVVLAGPGGIGKTALAEQLLDAARDRDFEVLRAQCRGIDSDPYDPLRAALPDEVLPDALTDDDPGVDVAHQEDLDADDYEHRRHALFYDLTAAIRPDDAPRVLFLDDLHLADPGTMSFVEYLLGQLSTMPVLFLGTYRPAELSGDPPFDPEEVPSTRLLVDQLGRESTRQLVERILDRLGPPEAFVQAVHEHTGGNPLFVEATVEALLDTDQLDPYFEWYPETTADIDLDERIHETIHQHMDGLDEFAWQVVEWAAVAGDSASVAVLEDVCDFSRERLHTRLEVLVGAGVFTWTARRRTVNFRNEVVRHAVLERLDDDDRRQRHADLAVALEALTAALPGEPNDRDRTGTRASTIAGHHEDAGNDVQAIEWYRKAADDAQSVYATEAAIDHCEAALEIASAANESGTVQSVAQKLAQVHVTTGEYDQASRYVEYVRERTPAAELVRRQQVTRLAAKIATERGEYETALAEVVDGLALRKESSAEVCRLLAVKAEVETMQGSYDRVEETASRLRDVATGIGADQYEYRASMLFGHVAREQGDYDRAREHYQRALDGFEAAGDHHYVGKVQNNLGETFQRQEDLEPAHEHYQRSLETFEAVGDRHSIAKVQSGLGIIAYLQGDYEQSQEYYLQSLEGFEKIGDRHRVARIRNNLGIAAMQSGDYEVAREYYQQAEERCRELGDRHTLSKVYTNLGIVAEKQSDYEQARTHHQQALDEFEVVGDRHGLAGTYNNLANAVQKMGDYEQAREYLQQAIEGYESVDDFKGVINAQANLGVAAAKQGDTEDARRACDRALSMIDDLTAAPRIADTKMTAGEILLHTGDLADAEAWLRESLDSFESLENPHQIGQCRVLLGRVRLAADDPDGARHHWQSALKAFEGIADPQDTLKALKLLVETCHERGDEDQAREWCRRAQAELAGAPEATADQHREWVRSQESDLGLQ